MKIVDLYVNNVGLGLTNLTITFIKENTGHTGIAFDAPVSWMSMSPETAVELATELIKFATAQLKAPVN